ncbi:MAG: putative lipopolysaccharide heptosyltransferase III [Deltaproteobacteria bacterium]|nr:putative lipopolysaccharide heptosyltransferase III [Deltaproteobacteria bacterium]
MIHVDGKKILVVKLRYIGDTLTILPVIDNLLTHAPKASIHVMVNRGTEEVLLHHPGIRKVWAYDRLRAKEGLTGSIRYHAKIIRQLRSERYDVVLDFSHGDRASFLCYTTGARFRISYENSSSLSHFFMNILVPADPSKVHVVDYQLECLRLFGMDRFNREFKLHVPPSAQSRVDAMLDHAGLHDGIIPWVAVHPGARGRLRQWQPGRFAEIARRLRSHWGAAVILIGGPGEGDLVDSVERLMGFSASFKSTGLGLLEMAAVLSRCRLFLGNDSAPGHMAAAVGCPTVSLFGPTFPHMWRPLSTRGAVVFKNVPCCGCRQERCVRPDETCMDLIGVEEVWEKVVRLIEGL